MKVDDNVAKAKRINLISILSTIVLSTLVIGFMLISVLSVKKLNDQIKLVTEHPFAESQDVGAINTNVALMRVRTDRLLMYNSPEDVDIVENALDVLYNNIEPLLDDITKVYLGEPKHTKELRATYDAIKTQHQLLLGMADNSNSEQILQFENTHLIPLYDQMMDNTGVILDTAKNTQMRVLNSSNSLWNTTLASSITITALSIFGLVMLQIYLKKAQKVINNKNQQFEILAKNIDETFLIFDNDDISCEYVADNSIKVLGVASESILKNRDILYNYVNKDDGDKIKRKLAGTDPSIPKEFSVKYYLPTTGEECWLMLKFYQTILKNGKRQIVTVSDETEDVTARYALQDALINANNANHAKRDFMSRMSHEIRTPMNAIIGMTTIAAACISNTARVEDCLAKISYSSKHLLMLINDILDMSRIENNKLSIANEPFDIYQFVNNFVSIVYSQAHLKGVEFSENMANFSNETTYIGDALRLNQILLNLTSNAIKFTPVGGKVDFEVRRISVPGSKDCLRFTVSDTGIGMDEDALKRIFTPFEQADSTIAQKYGGTGLGMSIAQNLVTLMGGTINITSKLNCGTQCVVEIPFDYSLQKIDNSSLEELSTMHVLVVDDQQDICEHTMLLLEKINIRANFSLSGEEAVGLVMDAQDKNDAYDVCFIDWKMPNMDGIETTKRIRSQVGQNTPIIIISAYDWSDIEEEARKAGANAFISKPLFLSSLYNVLVSVTQGNFGRKDNKSARTNSLKGKKILIAEDNELNLEIAEELLKMNGAIVVRATNGQEALQIFQENEPNYFDAILMDVQMPIMNGYEATQAIRALARPDGKTIPIIATTANAFTEDMSAALASGMNAHITKPIDIAKLCDAINHLSSHKNIK